MSVIALAVFAPLLVFVGFLGGLYVGYRLGKYQAEWTPLETLKRQLNPFA